MDEKEKEITCETCLYFDGVICDKLGIRVYPNNENGIDACWRYINEQREENK